MRINQFLALALGIGRRPADRLIESGQVTVNDHPAALGQIITASDKISYENRQLDVKKLLTESNTITIMFNKPVGYVVSRQGQGNKTIYDLLPKNYHRLKPIGRLDKDSSGLLLLTNDGQLSYELSHPSRQKRKIYEVALNKPLLPLDLQTMNDLGVILEDGPSRLQLHELKDGDNKHWQIEMYEGRNRQIRRTFQALGYKVTNLHRIKFGNHTLDNLRRGEFKIIK